MNILKRLFSKSTHIRSEAAIKELAKEAVIDVKRVDGRIIRFDILTGLSADSLREQIKNQDALQGFVSEIELRIKNKDYFEIELYSNQLRDTQKPVGLIKRALVDDKSNDILIWEAEITYSPEDYINNGYGQTVVGLMPLIANHFFSLPGWDKVEPNMQELLWFATFLSYIDLKHMQTRNHLTDKQIFSVCSGIAIKAQQIQYGDGFTTAVLQQELRAYNVRFDEYKALWKGYENNGEIGPFAFHSFEKIQAEIKTKSGYLEHCVSIQSLIKEATLTLQNIEVI